MNATLGLNLQTTKNDFGNTAPTTKALDSVSCWALQRAIFVRIPSIQSRYIHRNASLETRKLPCNRNIPLFSRVSYKFAIHILHGNSSSKINFIKIHHYFEVSFNYNTKKRTPLVCQIVQLYINHIPLKPAAIMAPRIPPSLSS